MRRKLTKIGRENCAIYLGKSVTCGTMVNHCLDFTPAAADD
jgi:hypothetical protein